MFFNTRVSIVVHELGARHRALLVVVNSSSLKLNALSSLRKYFSSSAFKATTTTAFRSPGIVGGGCGARSTRLSSLSSSRNKNIKTLSYHPTLSSCGFALDTITPVHTTPQFVPNYCNPNCKKSPSATTSNFGSSSGDRSGNTLRNEYFKRLKMSGKKKVCIVGSGNWGSAICKIVGSNTAKYPDFFDEEVKMYVFEELVDGRKLTEIINQDHENPKYLPGHKLPVNVVAVPDVLETAKDADIMIFVLPHQFIKHTCQPLVGKTKPGAFGLSLIKGFDVAEGGGIELISHIITKFLGIPCNVLMGANLAGEIANGKFSETTIGAHDVEQGKVLHKLIQTEDFRVVVVNDVETVEMCGALKNIVGVGAGFIDGLEFGDNTKAAVIRLGLMEMVRFAQEFYGHTAQLATFLESCGVADLITTCYGGRNRKVSEAFVRTGKSMEELEKEMLNGQRLQGPMTAAEVNHMLKLRGLEAKFPLFTAVHRICIGELKPPQLIDAIRNHPEHM